MATAQGSNQETLGYGKIYRKNGSFHQQQQQNHKKRRGGRGGKLIDWKRVKGKFLKITVTDPYLDLNSNKLEGKHDIGNNWNF